MNIFPIILIGVLVVGIIVFALYIRRNPFDEIPVKKRPSDCDDQCVSCGDVCAAGEVLRAQMDQDIPDFDDEALNAFAGRSGSDYSPEEEEQFEETLESLRTSEVAAWMESLRRRNIALPASLRDEAMMLITEK